MADIDNTRFLRFGGAKKSTFEMSPDELEQVSIDILNRAKEKAFSRGLAIYYGRNDTVFAEYADGKILEVK
jgi:hypothetical protein